MLTELCRADVSGKMTSSTTALDVRVKSCRPALMISVLVIADLISLAVAGTVALLPKWSVEGIHVAASYVVLIPFLSLFLLVFWTLGFYSGVSLSSPEELRRCVLACALVSLCIAASTVPIRESHMFFTWAMLPAVVLGIVAVPITREIVRFRYCRAKWWGYPTVIFGDEQSGGRVMRLLLKQPELGLKPVAFVCSSPCTADYMDEDVPIIDESELKALWSCLHRHGYALLSGEAEVLEPLVDVIIGNGRLFPHIVVVPDRWEFSNCWVSPKNLGGMFGLEIKEPLFQPSKRALKRGFDICLTVALLVLTAPLFLLIALAIKLDSPGSVFYSQGRIGRGGKEFRAWKFRSMFSGAEALLDRYLVENSHLAAEWLENHKLRVDPRITHVGRFLRRTSLDELPQLWNILCGEMSLVGPRPIVREEIPKYGRHFSLYTRVPGGLTGLWQVSGRSETSYEERVAFDSFYARNWSIWLDLYILFRTVGAVLVRAGAY